MASPLVVKRLRFPQATLVHHPRRAVKGRCADQTPPILLLLEEKT